MCKTLQTILEFMWRHYVSRDNHWTRVTMSTTIAHKWRRHTRRCASWWFKVHSTVYWLAQNIIVIYTHQSVTDIAGARESTMAYDSPSRNERVICTLARPSSSTTAQPREHNLPAVSVFLASAYAQRNLCRTKLKYHHIDHDLAISYVVSVAEFGTYTCLHSHSTQQIPNTRGCAIAIVL